MADYSLSLQRGFQDNVDPGEKITVGTSTPGAGDIELRISGTAGFNVREVYAALEQFLAYIADPTFTTFPGV